MIKWEKPMLISLTGTTEGLPPGPEPFACESYGSGDTNYCRAGYSAGGKCDANGTAPGGECREFGSGVV